MKKIISLLLAIILVFALSAPAFAITTKADMRDIHITVFGLDQPYTDRVWAVSNIGKVEFVQIWDGGKCVSGVEGSHVMLPNHEYMVLVRVSGAVGEVYINGIEHSRAWAFGDWGTPECNSTGQYDFRTSNFAPWQYCQYPCFGWGFGWYMPPMWGFGWRCW